MKNARFGFGGKKDKRNSAESHFGGPQVWNRNNWAKFSNRF